MAVQSSARVAVYFPTFPELAERLAARYPELGVVPVGEPEELIQHAESLEVLLSTGWGITREVAAQLPQLRWVQGVASGTDRLEAMLAERPDVLVTSGRGIHGRQMSEMVLLHMLGLSRRVQTLVRNQDEQRWDPVPQAVLSGKSVGIVGLGISGRQLAEICQVLDMEVHGIQRAGQPVPHVDHVYPLSGLHTMASQVDFLVLLVPQTEETRGFIDKSVFAAMKPTAFLVNLARGGVVVESDLLAALDGGEIQGAGLDVTAVEPLPADSPLWRHDRVFLTPHLGGQSDRYVEMLLSKVVLPNFRAYLEGAPESEFRNVIVSASKSNREVMDS